MSSRPIYIIGLLHQIPVLPPENYFTLVLRSLNFTTLQTNLMAIPAIALRSMSGSACLDRNTNQLCSTQFTRLDVPFRVPRRDLFGRDTGPDMGMYLPAFLLRSVMEVHPRMNGGLMERIILSMRRLAPITMSGRH